MLKPVNYVSLKTTGQLNLISENYSIHKDDQKYNI